MKNELKTITGLFLGAILLTSCGDNDGYNVNAHINKTNVCTIEGNLLACPDGTSIEIVNGTNGKDGLDGLDGLDGKDGLDGAAGAVVTTTNVLAGACTEIYPNVWAENINHGEIFDVYYNDMCKDNAGEYCDNVQTSYGASGTFGDNERGNGTVCLADDLMIVGKKLDNDSIDVKVINFN